MLLGKVALDILFGHTSGSNLIRQPAPPLRRNGIAPKEVLGGAHLAVKSYAAAAVIVARLRPLNVPFKQSPRRFDVLRCRLLQRRIVLGHRGSYRSA